MARHVQRPYPGAAAGVGGLLGNKWLALFLGVVNRPKKEMDKRAAISHPEAPGTFNGRPRPSIEHPPPCWDFQWKTQTLHWTPMEFAWGSRTLAICFGPCINREPGKNPGPRSAHRKLASDHRWGRIGVQGTPESPNSPDGSSFECPCFGGLGKPKGTPLFGGVQP